MVEEGGEGGMDGEKEGGGGACEPRWQHRAGSELPPPGRGCLLPPGLQRHRLLQARSRFCDGKRWERVGNDADYDHLRPAPAVQPGGVSVPLSPRGTPGTGQPRQLRPHHPGAAGFPCPLREPRQLLDNRKQCVVNGKRGWRRLNNFPLHHCPNKEL